MAKPAAREVVRRQHQPHKRGIKPTHATDAPPVEGTATYGLATYRQRFAPKLNTAGLGAADRAVIDDSVIDAACALIADGASLAEAAFAVDVSAIGLWKRLRDIESYQLAREVRAAAHASAVEQLLCDVASGSLTPDQGKVILAGAQWLIERLDGKRYSTRVKVDQTVTTDIAAQLDAAMQRVRGIRARIIDGDARQVLPDQS